jgi:hypothetical protein
VFENLLESDLVRLGVAAVLFNPPQDKLRLFFGQELVPIREVGDKEEYEYAEEDRDSALDDLGFCQQAPGGHGERILTKIHCQPFKPLLCARRLNAYAKIELNPPINTAKR